MVRYINPNFRKASNLILVSAGLGVINYLLIGSFTAFLQLTVVFLSLTFLFVTALLIRQGFNWAKWVYSILVVVGLFAMFNPIPAFFKANTLAACISGLQCVVQVLAVIVLFMPSKQPLIEASTESDII
jgi:hypothetical protein